MRREKRHWRPEMREKVRSNYWLSEGMTWPVIGSRILGGFLGPIAINGHEYKVPSVSKFVFVSSQN